ncbi:MAG: acetyltransferase, family, partial [Chloroflexi bacterium]|jgi:acetyltransferase|nr:acetyltransferase, family [Chloroflexota bacterium]
MIQYSNVDMIGQSPQDYPVEWIEQVQLMDGLLVTIRPIRADDAPRLQAGYRQLSSQSRYMRFLRTSNELPDQQAYQLANLDYHTQMAFVAEIETDQGPTLIAVARYAMIGPDRPGVAECAVVVGDDIQQRGLGTILMDRLGRYAVGQGIKLFVGTVHVTNAAMLRFIKRAGLPYERAIVEPGIWEVRVKLGG